jgi:thiamine biosynthesis lipoprotein
MVHLSRIHEELQERRGLALAITLLLSLTAVGTGCFRPVRAVRLATTAPAPPPDAALSEGRPVMGTVLEVTLGGPDPSALRGAAEDIFEGAAEFEQIFTTWDEDSALQRLNAAAGDGPQDVPPELVAILRDAKALSELTGGTFDVTIGPLAFLWRSAVEKGRWPGDKAIEAARARVGAQQIALPTATRVSLPDGVSIDLGGLAKGWTLDRGARHLASRGVHRALLNLGGSSLLAMGAPGGEDGWRVIVPDGQGNVAGILTLKDESASISRSLGRGEEIDGKPVGSAIDPKTGRTVNEPRTSLVVGRDGATAEALSTALLILPPAEGVALLNRVPGFEGVVVDASGAWFESTGFLSGVRFEPPLGADAG